MLYNKTWYCGYWSWAMIMNFRLKYFLWLSHKYVRSQGIALSVLHGVGCVSLPQANCKKTSFVARNRSKGREVTGLPGTQCGQWFKRRMSGGRWSLNTFWRVAPWWIAAPINHSSWGAGCLLLDACTAIAKCVGKFLWRSMRFTIRSLSKSIMLNNQTGRK